MTRRTAVVPCAGVGSRLAPLSNYIPKPFCPLVDTPSLALVLKELEIAGVSDAVVVIPSRGHSVEMAEYCSRDVNVDLHYVVQSEPRGLDQAIALGAAHPVHRRSMITVALPDVIPLPGQSAMESLLTHGSNGVDCRVTLLRKPSAEAFKHGVVSCGEFRPPSPPARTLSECDVEDYVEKPTSSIDGQFVHVLGGRYVFSPSVSNLLHSGHLSGLSSALYHVLKQGKLFGVDAAGMYLDTGNTADYVRAWVTHAMARSDLRQALIEVVDSLRLVGHDGG